MSATLSLPPAPSTAAPPRLDASDDTPRHAETERIRLRTEQIHGLWSMLPGYGANALMGYLVIALMCWPVVSPARIAAWFATTVLLSAALLIAGRRLCRPERVAARGPDRALRAYLVLGTAFAAVYSSALWWVVPPELLYVLAFGMLVLATLIGAPLQFGYLPLGVAYGLVAFASLAARLFWLGDPFAIGAGVTVLVSLVPYIHTLLGARRIYVEAYEARFRNEALARRLERSVAAELEARHAAQRADDAKTRFLAAASHDLRQPVHAGALFAEALAAEPLPPRAAELTMQLGRTLSGLDELLGRLLDISRFDAGQVPVQPGPVEVGAVVEQVVSRFAPVAERKGLALRVRRGRPAWVRSDPVLLAQVVANLVSNAVRHTVRGGVLVGVRRRGGDVVVEVVDTGPGIPAEHLDAIFEEFVQLGDEARDRREGLGLGLAIVRRLCERLGHDVGLVSVPGRGSRFQVRLAGADAAAAARRDPPVPDADAADVAGMLVLVVDDDVDVLAATDAALRTWGAETLLAKSADEALAVIADCERWPDAILTDHRLGAAQTGFDVLRRVVASIGHALPAIVMSADLDDTLERRVLEEGAALLRKPVDPRVLRERIADTRRLAP